MKITTQEMEKRKEKLFEKLRSDIELKHISDSDILLMVETMYKLEIKHGLLIIQNETN